MPQEIVAIIIVAIISATSVKILRTILEFVKSAKQERTPTPAQTESGVRVSELEGMIRNAVRDELVGVEQRMDKIERRLSDGRMSTPLMPADIPLPAEATRPLLAQMDDVTEGPEQPYQEGIRSRLT